MTPTTDLITAIERERSAELSEKLWFFSDPEVVKQFVESDAERIRELISIARSEYQRGFEDGWCAAGGSIADHAEAIRSLQTKETK